MPRGTHTRVNGSWVLRGNPLASITPYIPPTGTERGSIPKPNASNTGPRIAVNPTVLTGSEAISLAIANGGTLSGRRIGYMRLTQPEHGDLRFVDCEFVSGTYNVNGYFSGGGIVRPAADRRTVFEYCTFIGQTVGGTSSACVVGYNVILLHCDISYGVDGIKPFGNFEMYGCYLHDLWHPDGAHCDIVQIVSGRNILIHWNHMYGFNAIDSPTAGGSFVNGCLQTGALNGDIVDVYWYDNWVNGAHFTLRGVSSTAEESSYTVTNYVFRRNKHGRNFNYGPIAYMGVRVTYDNTNVWEDDGTPIRP